MYMVYSSKEDEILKDGNGPRRVEASGKSEDKSLVQKAPGIIGENKALFESVSGVKVADGKAAWDKNAQFGIRDSLENTYGIKSGNIGYDNGDVLLDGKFFMNAANNVDGTTYTYGKEDIEGALDDYYKNNNVVAVRDYVMNYGGVGTDISWNADKKTVTVNGAEIEPLYIRDGKAYVYKSQIDDLLSAQSGRYGVSNKSIYDGVNRKYASEIDGAYDEYMNAEKFSYNPDEDPEYQAFMAMAAKAAEDSYRNNMAAARFRTGGAASTGQMLTADAARRAAVNEMAAARSQYEQQAYNRYLEEQALAKDKLLTSRGVMVDDYNLQSGVNSAVKDDYYYGKNFDQQYGLNYQNLIKGNLENQMLGVDAGVYGQLVGNQLAQSDYATRDAAVDTYVNENYVPWMAELEMRNAELGYGDSAVYSDLYRNYLPDIMGAQAYSPWVQMAAIYGNTPNTAWYYAMPDMASLYGKPDVVTESTEGTAEETADTEKTTLSLSEMTPQEIVQFYSNIGAYFPGTGGVVPIRR